MAGHLQRLADRIQQRGWISDGWVYLYASWSESVFRMDPATGPLRGFISPRWYNHGQWHPMHNVSYVVPEPGVATMLAGIAAVLFLRRPVSIRSSR
jgi:hypothetical protein